MLIFQIALGVFLGLFIFHKYKKNPDDFFGNILSTLIILLIILVGLAFLAFLVFIGFVGFEKFQSLTENKRYAVFFNAMIIPAFFLIDFIFIKTIKKLRYYEPARSFSIEHDFFKFFGSLTAMAFVSGGVMLMVLNLAITDSTWYEDVQFYKTVAISIATVSVIIFYLALRAGKIPIIFFHSKGIVCRFLINKFKIQDNNAFRDFVAASIVHHSDSQEKREIDLKKELVQKLRKSPADDEFASDLLIKYLNVIAIKPDIERSSEYDEIITNRLKTGKDIIEKMKIK
jgi:hypothetical protein